MPDRSHSPGRCWFWVVLGWLALAGLTVEEPRWAVADDRPGTDAAQLRWDDPAIPPDEQARRALVAAGDLDAQAQRAKTGVESRARWLEATTLLDQCVARNPTVAAGPTLRFQAAVYLWARSRALLDSVELLAPTNAGRLDVAQGLDEVIERLRIVASSPTDPTDPFTQNIRFRLAQALADRTRLRPEADPARAVALREAQGLLDRSINSPQLRAFARLLHAELANRLGQFGPAQVEAEEAEKIDPPPPAVAVADAKIQALVGRRQFAEATQVVDRAAAPTEQKALWTLRIIFGRRQAALSPSDRIATEVEAFQTASAFPASGTAEARRGLMELTRAIDDPSPNSPPEWWELLAEGQLLRLDPARAAVLAAKGADRAELIQRDRAAPLRFKAGACWFQADRFLDAATTLARVRNDSFASAALRAKAGMLQALAQGRALAVRLPGASRAAYLATLEAQVRDFPDDPVSGEACWLLGQVRQASNRRDEAISLWSKIPHGQPRWLEAQVSAATQAIQQVEDQWTNRDESAIRPRYESARRSIRSALDQATEGAESFQLGMQLARLESIPGVGDPEEAIKVLDRLLRGPASSEQHRQARLSRMVALAEQNRFSDAEAIARTEAKGADLLPALDAIRRLDQVASHAEVDTIRKRTGGLIRLLLDRWIDPIDRTPPEDRDEVQLRFARALLFLGDTAGARRILARWGGPTGRLDDLALLRDLADTYFRLEAYRLAVDVERIRSAKLAAGSPAWFDARYGLSLALFRSDQGKEARKILDATTILHPELGGGETRIKFDRLRQKMSAEAN